MLKFIVITGGVISGLGKGIFTSSLGKLLQSCGYKVIPIKIDPYMNVDAGTMNPYEHGEVFVLDDKTEVDMDLGNYERFLNLNLKGNTNITTGKIYKRVIEKERRGDYLGKTVQIIPHLTNELQEWFKEVGKENNADIVMIEIGGTVGDIENLPFLEACRQLALKEDVVFIHVTLVPVLDVVGEQKSKPTQQSVQRLREIGIQPNFIVCRAKKELEKKVKEKIALFCNVEMENIISDPDIETIYEVPILLENKTLCKKVLEKLNLKYKELDLREWKEFVNKLKNPKKEIRIAITGKYTTLHDSYVSILEALTHACGYCECKPKIKWVETTDIEEGKITPEEKLKNIDGIIVPGGFGPRGAEGKIKCIKYARENKIPFLGLCFGFQLAVVEFARNVCGLEGANSTEIEPNTKYPIIDLLPEQKKLSEKGGTMRLGGHWVYIKRGTKAFELYKSEKIRERFRHRYEFNIKYKNIIEKNGLIFSGMNETKEIMQILELKEHPFFMGTQFHPEFTSRPLKPNPIFLGFVKSVLNK